MSEPRIVTPQEAQEMADASLIIWSVAGPELARTVATEPERIRAAVVEALRAFGLKYRNEHAEDFAEAIENGADW